MITIILYIYIIIWYVSDWNGDQYPHHFKPYPVRSPESHVPEGQNLYHNAIGQHLVQSYQRWQRKTGWRLENVGRFPIFEVWLITNNWCMPKAFECDSMWFYNVCLCYVIFSPFPTTTPVKPGTDCGTRMPAKSRPHWLAADGTRIIHIAWDQSCKENLDRAWKIVHHSTS